MVPYSYQSSIGVQRQFGDTIGVEADYAFTGGRREYHGTENMNLSYNPDTGVNYPFSEIARRPYPDFGILGIERMAGRSNYHGLQTGLHETPQEPVASLRHVLVRGLLGWGGAAAQRTPAGHLPGRTRPRWGL